MRTRLIRAMLLVSLPAAVAIMAPLAAASGAGEAQCNSKAGSYLFWPHGHPAIPSVGFPSFPTPHLELYGGLHRTSFPPSTQDAYIDATGAVGVARRCRTTPAGFINAAVSRAASTTAAHEIQCNFKALVSYRLERVAGGARLQTVLSGSAVVLDVKMSAHGSKITWDKRYCGAQPPPR